MSLARALTTRRNKQSFADMHSVPHRSNTTTKSHAHIASIRNKISSPMELTHTTNMLAYNAPDLYPKPASSPSRTSSSDDDAASESPSTTLSSPPTSPDMPAEESLSGSPEPNHLSCYFTAPTQKSQAPPKMQEAPTIPQRSPSHTKKASLDNMANKYARLSNQSSKTVSTQASFSLTRSPSNSTTATSMTSGSYAQKSPLPMTSTTSDVTPLSPPRFRRPTTAESHPFGQELAKVSELAEELGVKDKLQDAEDEAQQLIAQGLYRFTPQDYLSEIQGLYSTFFKPEHARPQAVWI
ncbi:hypothetical protein GGR57DRAFT_344375 [Xylariaceae sp. FL1272]|nr:hypothetical protein GGR57DRAFT_344375 [Xylariaceae sp. FL1272]